MRKNILIFCHHYATQFIDVCNQYTDLFDRKQYHVTVAYLRGVPDARAKARTNADEVIFLSQSEKETRGLKLGLFWRLLRFCRERRFAIVVCHRYKPLYLMLWVAWCVRIPLLFGVMHDLHAFTSLRRRLLVKCLVQTQSQYLAGVSNAVRDDMRASLRHWLPSARIITLYNCIDMPALERVLVSRHEALAALGLPPDRFVFGTLGRLEQVKDQGTMLRALARILPACPQAMLVIAGIGSEEQALKTLAGELGIADRVCFTGFVPEVWRYLRAFDVFLLTSLREAFGRVLPEAMTACVPVIGVTTDGIPEVIGSAGKVLSPGDVPAIAEAMAFFYRLTPEERNAWGRRGYGQIEQHFSLPRFRETFWGLA